MYLQKLPEQFSFPYFDLILPGPGRCGFLTNAEYHTRILPDLHKKNAQNPNNLLKLNASAKTARAIQLSGNSHLMLRSIFCRSDLRIATLSKMS